MSATLLAAVLSAFAFAFTWTGAANKESQRKVPANASQQRAKSESLFRRNCSRCHGVDGRGQTALGKLFEAPNFTDSDWWALHSNNKELIDIITNGKKHMPSFGKKLTRPQIAGLANYVQSFKP